MANLNDLILILFVCVSILEITKTAAFVNLTVNPAVLYTNMLTPLTVNCTFNKKDSTNIAHVLSMIIYKHHPKNPNNITALATATLIPPDVRPLAALNAAVSGQIDQDKPVSLSLRWEEYTSAAEAGIYHCNVTGMDSVGRCVKSSNTSIVSRYLTTETVCNDSFISSPEYNDTFYCLSKSHNENLEDSESQCHSFGGYLAEIYNEHQYNFIKDFLKGKQYEAPLVMIGASSDNQEHQWLWRHTKEPVTVFFWDKDNVLEPERNKCVFLHNINNWTWFNMVCTYNRPFLCEIPKF